MDKTPQRRNSETWIKSNLTHLHVFSSSLGSGIFYALTPSTPELIYSRMEIFSPYSSLDPGLWVGPLIHTVFGSGVVAEPLGSEIVKSFFKTVDLVWELAHPPSSHGFQGLKCGFSPGACTCFWGLVMLLSAAQWIMEFYWLAEEAWGDAVVLAIPFISSFFHAYMYSPIIG